VIGIVAPEESVGADIQARIRGYRSDGSCLKISLGVSALPRVATVGDKSGVVGDHHRGIMEITGSLAELDRRQVSLAVEVWRARILHHHRAAETLLDSVFERLVTPGQVRREQHGGAGAVDEPGRAEADGRDLVTGLQLGHHVGDGLLGTRRAGRRSRSLELGQDLAIFVDYRCCDLRATDVNADGKGHWPVSP